MIKAGIISISVFLVVAAGHAEPRTYSSLQGDINISKLEKVLSESFGADVVVESMRVTVNPGWYLINLWNLSFKRMGVVGIYVMDLLINGGHEAQCLLFLDEDKETAGYAKCESETLRLKNRMDGGFPFSDLGLPARKNL